MSLAERRARRAAAKALSPPPPAFPDSPRILDSPGASTQIGSDYDDSKINSRSRDVSPLAPGRRNKDKASAVSGGTGPDDTTAGFQFKAVDPGSFSQGFTVDGLLMHLGRDVLKTKPANPADLEGQGTAPLAAKTALSHAAELVTVFDRAELELCILQKEVDKQVSHLQQIMSRQNSTYQNDFARADELLGQLRQDFKTVEDQSNRISQVGMRLGDRLQTAESHRSKAVELIQLLHHMHAFSQLRPAKEWDQAPDVEYRKLPNVFWEDKSLAEAADLARKLTRLTAEAHNAAQRHDMMMMPGSGSSHGGGGGADGSHGALQQQHNHRKMTKGSLDYTTLQLARYCTWLEHRVLFKFDAALAAGSRKGMATAASIMAKFDAEKLLVQKYVSSLPIFSTDPDNAQACPEIKPPAVGSPAQLSASMRPFNALADLLLDTVQQEVGRMSGIFSATADAVMSLIDKLADEKLVPAMETLLLPPEMPEDDSSSTEEESDEDGSSDEDVAGALPTRPPAAPTAAGGSKTLQPNRRSNKAFVPEETEEDEESDESDEDDSEAGADNDAEYQIANLLGRGSVELPDNSRHGQRKDSNSKKHQNAHGWGRRAPRTAEDPDNLDMRLNMLVLVHTRVLSLLDSMQQCCSAAGLTEISLTDLAAHLFDPYMANYPYPELRWLDMSFKILFSKQQMDVSLRGMSASSQQDSLVHHHEHVLYAITARQLIKNNARSIDRAAALSQGNDVICAAHTCLLFYGAGPFQDQPGSLLDQLARTLLDGLEYVIETADLHDPAARAKQEVAAFYESREKAQAAATAAAEAARKKGLPLPPPKPPVIITASQAAEPAEKNIRSRVRPALQALKDATLIMADLQAHYKSVVYPRVLSSLPELDSCSSGVVLVAKAVEDSATALLQRVVDATVIQAEVTLLMHQQRTDFWPEFEALQEELRRRQEEAEEGGSRSPSPVKEAAPEAGRKLLSQVSLLSLGRPTNACMLVCALLAVAADEGREALQGSNLESFLQEIGLRVQSLLLNHMRQFRYSATGALRWKCDVTQYCDLMRSWDVEALREHLQTLQDLVNVLVVPAESLLPLVDGGLKMDHAQAVPYLSLRLDWETARVGGKSLMQLFSRGGGFADVAAAQFTAANAQAY